MFITAEDLTELVKQKEANNGILKLVDVRDIDFRGGHIKGAINITIDNFESETFLSDFLEECKEEKIQNIVYYCQYGEVRSVKAYNRTKKYINDNKCNIGVNVYYLQGGFEYYSSADSYEKFIEH